MLWDEGFNQFMATACDPLAPNGNYTKLCKFRSLITTDEADYKNNADSVKKFQQRYYAPYPLKAFA